MSGATEDPSVIINNPPNKNKNNIIGKSQYFFLTLKNSKNSFKNDILKNFFLLYFSLFQFI